MKIITNGYDNSSLLITDDSKPIKSSVSIDDLRDFYIKDIISNNMKPDELKDKKGAFVFSGDEIVSFQFSDKNSKLAYECDRINLKHFENLYLSKNETKEQYQVILKFKESKACFMSELTEDYNKAEDLLIGIKEHYSKKYNIDTIYVRCNCDVLDFENTPNNANNVKNAFSSPRLSLNMKNSINTIDIAFRNSTMMERVQSTSLDSIVKNFESKENSSESSSQEDKNKLSIKHR